MKVFRCGVAAALLVWAAAPALAESKAWQDVITLPTWLEGPPDTAPRMDSLDPTRAKYYQANYPYPTRANFTDKQEPQEWRRLNLENEYLLCSFLPDLGGHLYTCIDKLNGRSIFRANPSIKRANIGVRGAWVALGIEWNFPVAHSRDTASPVNFGFRQEKDRAEVWVGNVDRVTGMEWLAEFVLRDGSAVLEEHVTLRNDAETRHPYIWWANADVVLDAGTRFVYPARVMSWPGLEALQTWPLNPKGLDLSNPANDKEAAALFAYGSREPFMAIYNANSRTAAVHVADPGVVTGKKLWTWGVKDEEFRHMLSDDGAGYVEMQAGLFSDQETYHQLQPQHQVQFTELWFGARELDSVTRANEHGILSMERQTAAGKSALQLELNVTHAIAGAQIRVLNGAATVLDEKADLTPAKTYTHSIPDPVKSAYRFELRDGSGVLLMAHTEGVYETVDPKTVTLGPQPPHIPGVKREQPGDFLALGGYNEENSNLTFAEGDYRAGLGKSPKDVALLKALGRLLVERQRYAEALPPLSQAASSWAADPELRYYLGLALSHTGREDEGRRSWAVAAADAHFGAAAMVQLAESQARAGQFDAALELAAKTLARSKSSLTAWKIQVALLRRAGKTDEARKQLEQARSVDALDLFLRLQGIQLGEKDDSFWTHLGADPERVLDIARIYFDLGLYQDAMTVLDRKYAAVPANQTEPGSVLPQDHALVSYYRGYCREKQGQSGAGDFQLASSQKLEYVFPNRAESEPVLQAAIRNNPKDASAHFLLGLLYLNGNRTANAIAELQAARAIRKDIPELYFVLARALLPTKDGKEAAVSVLKEGLESAPSSKELKDVLAEAMAPPKSAPASIAAPPPSSTPAPTAPDGAKSAAAAGAGKTGSPVALAAQLLEETANGNTAAVHSFTVANFPQPKQPESVRQTYIELQLQQLRWLSGRNCKQALAGVETIGDEDKNLPFTMYGFGEWMKGARFQYYLGAVAGKCGDEKEARRRWAKVAKMTPAVDSPDFAFPLVAAQNIAPRGKGPDVQPWLDKVNKALEGADAETKGALLFSQGILLLAKGDEPAAYAALQKSAEAPDHEMSRYLSELALQEAGVAGKRSR